jgi:hypothetical protein
MEMEKGVGGWVNGGVTGAGMVGEEMEVVEEEEMSMGFLEEMDLDEEEEVPPQTPTHTLKRKRDEVEEEEEEEETQPQKKRVCMGAVPDVEELYAIFDEALFGSDL